MINVSLVLQDGTESDTVTRKLVRGSVDETLPCPLKECAHRKFAATDIYSLKRHFTQVHPLTYPDPLFVFQCPVEECGAEFENSMGDMRKHLIKHHPELFETPGKKSAAKTRPKPGKLPLNGSMQVAEEEKQEELEGAEDGEKESRG